MPYDHSTKIGNHGDVLKHIALFAALRHLLGHSERNGRRFGFADIHAGRPQYVLPDKGEWQVGIGRFSNLPEIRNDRKRRNQGKPTELGIVGEFDETVIGRRLTSGMIYPGSAGIAFRLLRESKVGFTMKLWEHDRAAADDSLRYFFPWHEQVTTVCGNGYEVTKEKDPFSLVLIDPPRIEQADSALETMRQLAAVGSPYLCWMPRTARSVPPEDDEDPSEKWASEEAATSKEYITSAVKHGRCLCILWKPEWGPNPGCSITASPKIAEIVAPAVKRVAEMMGWGFAG